MSCHVISYHIISYHIISYHITSHHVTSHHIISYIMSYHYHYHYHHHYHVISYHISYHITSYCIFIKMFSPDISPESTSLGKCLAVGNAITYTMGMQDITPSPITNIFFPVDIADLYFSATFQKNYARFRLIFGCHFPIDLVSSVSEYG